MTDTVQAYILMVVEIGKTDEVLTELKTIDEAVRVAVTTGEYDIVVLVEVPDLEGLYEITVNRIHKIPGIAETTTAVVEKMISI
ncbi:MAG: Lrp/AsnC ligand binding domain-containing protein [Candidatus Thorarchaeota archaeon]